MDERSPDVKGKRQVSEPVSLAMARTQGDRPAMVEVVEDLGAAIGVRIPGRETVIRLLPRDIFTEDAGLRRGLDDAAERQDQEALRVLWETKARLWRTSA